MSGDVQLLLLVSGVHMFAIAAVAVLMLPALRDGWNTPPGASGSDGEDGGGPGVPPTEPAGRPSGGLPLPDAEQSRVRLREPGRLADQLPPRERRPAREPERAPVKNV